MHFRFLADIFDLPVTLTSEIIHVSPSVLLDLEMWRKPLEFRVNDCVYIIFVMEAYSQTLA